MADISCAICGKVVGWKYVDAREEAQKYKIGKFILEMKRVVVTKGWEDVAAERGWGFDAAEEREGEWDGDDVMFDSENEDECDEIFAGTWDRAAVRRRRARAASE